MNENGYPLFAADERDAEVYTVTALTAAVRATIEGAFDRELAVRGEISNFKHHASRHMYFSLKDEGAVLRCVFFHPENARVRFAPGDGLAVVARGRLGVYPPQGAYQLYVSSLTPRGEGDLRAAWERLKARLSAEGLFAPERKRPLPRFPQTVGVVTSRSGAAFRDIKNVLSRRWPGIGIILRPTKVQGAGAADDVAQAIRDFDVAGVADVLIVGRGGGSLEDLWAFNEEATVRAIAGSKTPVISAVGHEVDWTLADLAADLRAPTPSAAAELAVRARVDVAREVGELRDAAADAVADGLAERHADVDAARTSYAFRAVPRRLTEKAQGVDDGAARAGRAARHALAAYRARYDAVAQNFRPLSPAATLARGFNLAVRAGRTVTRAAHAAPGDALTLHFADGTKDVHVADSGEDS